MEDSIAIGLTAPIGRAAETSATFLSKATGQLHSAALASLEASERQTVLPFAFAERQAKSRANAL